MDAPPDVIPFVPRETITRRLITVLPAFSVPVEVTVVVSADYDGPVAVVVAMPPASASPSIFDPSASEG
jgi:hypothetical protein